jgi:hypothetical protein
VKIISKKIKETEKVEEEEKGMEVKEKMGRSQEQRNKMETGGRYGFSDPYK